MTSSSLHVEEHHFQESLNLADDLSKNHVSNSTLNLTNLNPKFPSLPKMRGFKLLFAISVVLLVIMTNCAFSWKIEPLTYLV